MNVKNMKSKLASIVTAVLIAGIGTPIIVTGQNSKTSKYSQKEVVELTENAYKKDCYIYFISLGDGRFLSHMDMKDLKLGYNHTDTDVEEFLSLLGKDVKKSPERYGFNLKAELDDSKRFILRGDSNNGITEYSFSKGYDEKFLKFEDADKKFKEKSNELLAVTKKVFNVEEFMKYGDGVSFIYNKGKFHNTSNEEAQREKYNQKLKELANEIVKTPESDFETIKNTLSIIFSYAQTEKAFRR